MMFVTVDSIVDLIVYFDSTCDFFYALFLTIHTLVYFLRSELNHPNKFLASAICIILKKKKQEKSLLTHCTKSKQMNTLMGNRSRKKKLSTKYDNNNDYDDDNDNSKCANAKCTAHNVYVYECVFSLVSQSSTQSTRALLERSKKKKKEQH